MERARQKLLKLQKRVDSGAVKQPEKIGAAVERVMQKYHGYRYFEWKLGDGSLVFSENKKHFEREKRIEGKYVIATSENELSLLDAVAMYKELTDVESGFRQLVTNSEFDPCAARSYVAPPQTWASRLFAIVMTLAERANK